MHPLLHCCHRFVTVSKRSSHTSHRVASRRAAAGGHDATAMGPCSLQFAAVLYCGGSCRRPSCSGQELDRLFGRGAATPTTGPLRRCRAGIAGRCRSCPKPFGARRSNLSHETTLPWSSKSAATIPAPRRSRSAGHRWRFFARNRAPITRVSPTPWTRSHGFNSSRAASSGNPGIIGSALAAPTSAGKRVIVQR